MRCEGVCVERRQLVPELLHACRSKTDGVFKLPRWAGANEIDDGGRGRKVSIVEEHPATDTDVWRELPPVEDRIGETMRAVNQDEVERSGLPACQHLVGGADPKGHTGRINAERSALASHALLLA